MIRKWASIIVSFCVASMIFAGQPSNVLASAYDQTAINSDLNATMQPDHLALTWSADPTQTMTVNWRTSTAVGKCNIEYREENGPARVVTVTPHLFSTSDRDNITGQMNVFSTTLINLKPGTKYYYRISNGNEWTDAYSFTTESVAAVNTNKFKFLVFGDSQSGNFKVPDYLPWHVTLSNAYSANMDAEFFVNMGDLVEKGQYYQHWNNWFDAAKGVIDHIPDMVVQGNHETYDAADWNSTKPEYYVRQFHVFQNGPEGLKGQTYSYDYGKVHFVVLDSQGEEESEDAQGRVDLAKEEGMFNQQAQWLAGDLEQHKDATFTIVMFHKTPYYNKGNRSNSLIKEIFTPVFDKYHVDVVFNGHDHATSRTFPIYHDEFVQSPAQGTVYYVTGRSGAKYYPDLTPKVWDAKFYDPQDQPDYQTVELDGKKLTIKAFKQDGTLIDTYVIDKAHPENNTSNNEMLPARYNTEKDSPAIGNSVKLILFGNMAYGRTSLAKIVDGKAYADIKAIAGYAGGSYDPSAKILTVPLTSQKNFQLTDAMLTDNGTKVSIDALNEMGWDNRYDEKYNMVFIDTELKG